MKNLRGIAVCAVAFMPPAILFMTVTGPTSALFSQYLGVAALIAMALSQIMATRARFVEHLFGPMDQAYVLHKWLGICALAAILLHDNIGAEIKALGKGTALSDFAEGVGEQSLNGLMILIAITLITFIPYRIWYWTHRAMGACFVMGALHFALILKPFSVFDPLGLYVLAFCALGVLSYFYTLLPLKWKRGHHYKVVDIERTGNAHAITLAPQGHPLRHRAGQFAFFTVEQSGLSETHPFSISSAAHKDGNIRITVATLGDYTKKLNRKLQVGTSVKVQGPFGRFTPKHANKPQVWIAGGVGITPFLAWLNALDAEGASVDLIYTFRGAERAPHLAEIRRLVAQNNRVTLHVFDTATGPRLTAKAVAKIVGDNSPRYAYCGPAALRDALRKGIGGRHFRDEAFEIRTGLPLPKWLTQAAAAKIQQFRTA